MSSSILQKPTTLLNNTLSKLDNFYVPIGGKINVYKFRKTSGFINLTRYGELPLNVNTEKMNQNFSIYTGNEPITVVWNNSCKIEANKETNKIINTIQVGDYETCFLVNSKVSDLETTNKNIFNKDFTTNIVSTTITLNSQNWIPTDDDVLDYFYLILDRKSQSYKWLEIINFEPVFNLETNNLEYCEITMKTINDKYTSSGKSIIDFIQFGAIGEMYCFPKETINSSGDIVVSLEEKYLTDDGITSLQLDFTSGAALSSLMVVGRRKSKKINDNQYELSKPQFLWLYDTQRPYSSAFFYNQPNLNSFLGCFLPTKIGVWQSYKNSFAGNKNIGEYNILNTKEVLCGFKEKYSVNEVRNTNPGGNVNCNWDNDQKINYKWEDKELQYDINPYVNPSGVINRKINYANFFNINSYMNFYSDVFNFEYNETKKYKLSDVVGILGGVVNILVGGLDIGWTTNANLSQTGDTLNIAPPCISYNEGKIALDEQAPLPPDVFFDEKSKQVLPTSTNVLTSWRFRLTDRVQDTSQVREKAPLGKGGNGVWDLIYLGQTKFEDGTYINIDKTPFRLNLQTTSAAIPSDNSTFEYIIDYIDYKAIASCDCRITAYGDHGNTLYYLITETKAKARGDIRIWGNSFKFNYWDNINSSGEINYPEYVENSPIDYNQIGFEVPIEESQKYFIELPKFWQLETKDITPVKSTTQRRGPQARKLLYTITLNNNDYVWELDNLTFYLTHAQSYFFDPSDGGYNTNHWLYGSKNIPIDEEHKKTFTSATHKNGVFKTTKTYRYFNDQINIKKIKTVHIEFADGNSLDIKRNIEDDNNLDVFTYVPDSEEKSLIIEEKYGAIAYCKDEMLPNGFGHNVCYQANQEAHNQKFEDGFVPFNSLMFSKIEIVIEETENNYLNIIFNTYIEKFFINRNNVVDCLNFIDSDSDTEQWYYWIVPDSTFPYIGGGKGYFSFKSNSSLISKIMLSYR